MEKIEKLIEPGNPFDDGSRINQNYFKAMRDVIVELNSKIKTLEARLEPVSNVEGEVGFVEPPLKKKGKK